MCISAWRWFHVQSCFARFASFRVSVAYSTSPGCIRLTSYLIMLISAAQVLIPYVPRTYIYIYIYTRTWNALRRIYIPRYVMNFASLPCFLATSPSERKTEIPLSFLSSPLFFLPFISSFLRLWRDTTSTLITTCLTDSGLRSSGVSVKSLITPARRWDWRKNVKEGGRGGEVRDRTKKSWTWTNKRRESQLVRSMKKSYNARRETKNDDRVASRPFSPLSLPFFSFAFCIFWKLRQCETPTSSVRSSATLFCIWEYKGA